MKNPAPDYSFFHLMDVTQGWANEFAPQAPQDGYPDSFSYEIMIFTREKIIRRREKSFSPYDKDLLSYE